MDRDDVERVVETQDLLQPQRNMTDQPGEPADDDRGVRVDQAGARRDRSQPGDRAGDSA